MRSTVASAILNDTTLNAEVFRKDLKILSDAAIAIFAIRTREPFRALSELNVFAKEAEIAFKTWTCLTGWQEFEPSSEGTLTNDYSTNTKQDECVGLEQALDKIKKDFGDGVYVIFGGHYALDDPSIQQHIQNYTQHCLDNQKRIVFVWPEAAKIPPAIEDNICIIDFKPPSLSELRETWNREMDNIEDGYKPDFDADEVNLILRSALGMTQQEFSNSCAISLVELGLMLQEKRTVPMDFVRIILRQKVDIIKRTDILELLEEANIDQIGGLDLLKEWLGERSEAMTSSEAREFGIDAPRGVLIVGPPGGGKSQIAKATAATMHVSGIKLDIGRVFAGIVGASEERCRTALAMVDAMAPVVLLVDEVDKGLGGIGGSGDSGVSQRVLGTILSWMQDRQGPPVFLIFTANNVTGLPPELMRKGRLDEIFAVTFPGEVERAQIVKIHVEKRGHEISDADTRKVANETNAFVGAELEALVKEGLIKQFNGIKKGEEKSLVEYMVPLAKATVPLSVAFADKVKIMNDWAKNNAKPASRAMSFEPTVQKVVPGQGRLIRRPGGAGPIKPKSTTN